jgi:hypothetical protein
MVSSCAKTLVTITLVSFLISVVAHASWASDNAVCNTDEDRKAARDWNYNLVDAYEFGLTIQKHVRNKDLQSLFGLVSGELRYGLRKKSIVGKSFSDVFDDNWRERILFERPPCSPVGWRGFMLDHGTIWYERDYETHEWSIVTIGGAKVLEGSKNPPDGRWRHNGNLLSVKCFTTIWSSSDNYEEFFDTFVNDENANFAHVGQYMGDLIPLAPLQASWGDEISVAVKLSSCVQNGEMPKVEMRNGWVEKESCDEYGCLTYSYRLIKRLSLDHCGTLAPHFSEDCVDLGLVQVSKESGGTIGNIVSEVVYGVIDDPVTNEVYVMPLENFQSLNDALNLVDQLEAVK